MRAGKTSNSADSCNIIGSKTQNDGCGFIRSTTQNDACDANKFTTTTQSDNCGANSITAMESGVVVGETGTKRKYRKNNARYNHLQGRKSKRQQNMQAETPKQLLSGKEKNSKIQR